MAPSGTPPLEPEHCRGLGSPGAPPARAMPAEQIEHARGHLSAEGRQQIAAILGCELERLDAELDTLAARAKPEQ